MIKIVNNVILPIQEWYLMVAAKNDANENEALEKTHLDVIDRNIILILKIGCANFLSQYC